jgi:hypothetical protein
MREFDSQKPREFYDPHPLIFGTQMCSPPSGIVSAAQKLSGKTLSVGEAQNILVGKLEEGKLIVKPEKNCICLEVAYNDKPYDAGHTFILIKFR